MQGWSLLPQGSGLGTSSILASAILAAIYTCQGVSFNRSQLVHAVRRDIVLVSNYFCNILLVGSLY